ncbi:MAG: hypothetical protein KDB23_24850, partial [Planctomycetales bacterium]|nr:hypothetical protein [Planctomycetales bacterium]
HFGHVTQFSFVSSFSFIGRCVTCNGQLLNSATLLVECCTSRAISLSQRIPRRQLSLSEDPHLTIVLCAVGDDLAALPLFQARVELGLASRS